MKRSRRRKRVLGPGVVERPAPSESDLLLTKQGLRRSGDTSDDPGFQTLRPRFDASLPRVHPGPQHRVTQIVLEPNQGAIHDVVVPITQQVSSWHCYGRSVRGNKWRGVAPVQSGTALVVLSVGRSKLYVREFGPSPADSEIGEIAWRWRIENVATGRGTRLLVRFVIKLRRRPSSG